MPSAPAPSDKLREAQALLRHQSPDGELAEIFDRALTLLVEEVKRKKFAQTSHGALPEERAAHVAEGCRSRGR